MPFPAKQAGGAAPAGKKPRKFNKDGTMVGCDRVMGPMAFEIDGRTIDVEVQVSRRAQSGLVKLAAAALKRADGVKEVQGGLFRVVARPSR